MLTTACSNIKTNQIKYVTINKGYILYEHTVFCQHVRMVSYVFSLNYALF